MNVESAPSYGSANGNGNFINATDTSGYYYNGGAQMLQQPHGMADPQHQQQQQQHAHQQQQQQQQNMAYPMSPSPSSLFRFGAGNVHTGISSPALARALSTLSADKNRRPRSEKKPIPDDQKDDKYYERRRRNNEAAKKSRDARKAREDELAIRASFLEKDNSILKVQVHSMREEAMKLRELWVAKCQGLAMNRGNQAIQAQARNSMQNPVLTQVQNSMGPQAQGRSS